MNKFKLIGLSGLCGRAWKVEMPLTELHGHACPRVARARVHAWGFRNLPCPCPHPRFSKFSCPCPRFQKFPSTNLAVSVPAQLWFKLGSSQFIDIDTSFEWFAYPSIGHWKFEKADKTSNYVYEIIPKETADWLIQKVSLSNNSGNFPFVIIVTVWYGLHRPVRIRPG